MEEFEFVPISFCKYHGLGNDYLIIEPGSIGEQELAEFSRCICDRHYGVGGDGLLVGPTADASADFSLQIFNPDGSEAEKSGNGLRIFARYLLDTGRVGEESFTIRVPGGIARCQVFENGRIVRVQMGKANFHSSEIPVNGDPRLVIAERIQIGQHSLHICALSLGNPHCVVLDAPVSAEIAHLLGPQIERHSLFPRRTNVQFLGVLDRQNLRIEIWERGAGYTFASGSSACAAASAAYELGWCDADVQVHMPGGALRVSIAADGEITLTGPVSKVCDGRYWLGSGSPITNSNAA